MNNPTELDRQIQEMRLKLSRLDTRISRFERHEHISTSGSWGTGLGVILAILLLIWVVGSG